VAVANAFIAKHINLRTRLQPVIALDHISGAEALPAWNRSSLDAEVANVLVDAVRRY